MNWTVSGYEHGNESAGYVEGREFVDQESVLLATEEGLSYLELFN